MPKRPRLADIFGPDKPKRRPLVTQDGTTIARDNALPASCRGEPMAIWGEPLALDERPEPSVDNVTFDGAMPSRKS